MRTCLTVVLAAGEGTRMRSALPKVLHPVGGLPMLAHVLKAVAQAGGGDVAVVIGPDHKAVEEATARYAPGASTHIQSERLGTGHAVLAARAILAKGADDILVVYGDTPSVTADTLSRLRAALAGGASVVVAGMVPPDPQGYGRLIVESGQLVAIREEKDAGEAERRIRLCNGGLMALSGDVALELLDAIGNQNAKGEYYLTDAVELANARGLRAEVVEIPADDAFGVNTRAQLAEAEAIFQRRARDRAMAEGATLVAPETVFFSHDTQLGRDVTVEVNVVFGPGVTVGDGLTIRAFSHLEGATVATAATIGPFARLRPGARIGEGAHIGNFVEIKAAEIGPGAKVNHLSYIGDASVGAKSNIGAGTITCNYDGFGKYSTEIGKRAFIGSNSALVAPVRIGDDAYVASGSVITDDVASGALALGRAQQVEKPGWVERFRARMAGGKRAG